MKEIVLNVSGMMCNGCENRIINALKDINGVDSVYANHTNGEVKVIMSDNINEVNEKTISEIIQDLGFEVE